MSAFDYHLGAFVVDPAGRVGRIAATLPGKVLVQFHPKSDFRFLPQADVLAADADDMATLVWERDHWWQGGARRWKPR